MPPGLGVSESFTSRSPPGLWLGSSTSWGVVAELGVGALSGSPPHAPKPSPPTRRTAVRRKAKTRRGLMARRLSSSG